MTDVRLMFSMVDRRVTNVLLNGLAVMMAYAGMLGGAAVMPTIFKDMKGEHGLTEESAFYGLIICNVAVILTGPFTPSISQLLGTRTSVVISVLLCGTINNVLFYPTNYLVYSAFLLNGVGCALLRVAALAYMTKNSTRATLSRHTSIHWTMVTVGLMLGNGIVMLVNMHTAEIDPDKRYKIATAMSVVCLLAIPGYFCTKRIPADYEEQLATRRRETEVLRNPELAEKEEEEKPVHIPPPECMMEEDGVPLRRNSDITAAQRILEMCRTMTRRETFLLLAPMIAAGVYCTAYSPILPTSIGQVSKQPWLISAFGILVGVGQLCGTLLAGSAVDHVSMRQISRVVASLSCLTFGLFALVVRMGFSDSWSQWVKFSQVLTLILAFFVGACDMANNVCLTVAIGRVYKTDSDAAFSLFITCMSMSMVLWYLLFTFAKVYVILGCYAVVCIITAMSYSLLKF